ncbi:hypothetical protein GOBAR_AA37391 [Gossypium barbadense]|uniref:tRNA (guanosine(18)-2'-O)-methyltransferase TARBP1 n=1 Tax=Gossypium barbadense TaxID=3634 RepID=A0A2P5VWU3_GOSBA|nr:hypothetical protein GOBAR_AA37391 [Gossypium barbadense]
MAAAVISSLSKSFGQIPPSAIPPMLDCILTSTAVSSSSLFSSLLDDLPDLIESGNRDGKLDSDRRNSIASMIGALCHLLTKANIGREELQSFLWKGFIPLMKMGHDFDQELLNQIADSFFDVVQSIHAWEVLEENLVPFSLRSIGLSAGIIQNGDLQGTGLDRSSLFHVSSDLIEKFIENLHVGKDCKLSISGYFPLPVSCHVLSITLDAALRNFQAAPVTGSVSENVSSVESFTANLLWNLCNATERLLLQGSESRSCTIGFLLPVIFKAFVSQSSFEISVHRQIHKLSRNHFFMRMWTCCRKLFSLGSLERRDAYRILSLYLSYFSCGGTFQNANMSDGAEEFDIRSEKDLWNEIKRGLVDEDGLVRKQSLHILKTLLCTDSGNQHHSDISEKKTQGKHSVPHGVTKRELWAYKEAKSLGVGKLCNSVDSGMNSQQQWEAFVLLFEMLEEYGTHLVEAAWNHQFFSAYLPKYFGFLQITSLLQFSVSHDNFVSAISGSMHQTQSETWAEVFSWLSILWKRGFCHDNPQVRCMIMQSFLGIEWRKYGSCVKSVPESFILGSLMEALNDPVHHSDFGVKGIYSSKTIEGATHFLHHYSSYLDARETVIFLKSLASLAKRKSFSRAGLMGLAECIAASAFGAHKYSNNKVESCEFGTADEVQPEYSLENFLHDNGTELLDFLRYVLESSKQHFNPNYRFRVCEKVVEAAASMVPASDVSLEILLHFISTLPREVTDYGGLLRVRVQDWLLQNHQVTRSGGIQMQLLESLNEFPEWFIIHHCLFQNFDDEDLGAWEFEVRRWARVLFLVIKEEHQLAPLMTFIQQYGTNIRKQNNYSEWVPVKFLTLILGLIQEIQVMQRRKHGAKVQTKFEIKRLETEEQSSEAEASNIYNMFTDSLLLILEELVSFCNLSCSIFSSGSDIEDKVLPSSVRGKLGGPSQRRLSISLTTAVLQATISVKAVAYIYAWCAQHRTGILLNSAFTAVWKFFCNTITSPTCNSESEAEVRIAAYEALAPALKALVSVLAPQSLVLFMENSKSLQPAIEGEPWLDTLVFSFLQNINNLLAVGFMARTRRAVLLNWKWVILESLLSIPYYSFGSKLQQEDGSFFFSDAALINIFTDTFSWHSLFMQLNDKELAKELYKKYSAIHRRKIRAWQMICVLSQFVDDDIVGEVTQCLQIALYRNNLPSVRQYLETFAINIYMKFPSLVAEQLVPLLRDYDMRPQALSSYVFIAANVILHASKDIQLRHLDELLPPILPLLTSHHHSLRGFTQVLLHRVLCKFFPSLDSKSSEFIPLEKRCFEDLKLYLANNSDCMRLRASMEGYLDAYNPKTSVTPAGIFVSRVEEIGFECVPTSLMEQVINFLNDVREDLRCSMAKDIVTIKNESLNMAAGPGSTEEVSSACEEKLELPKDAHLDFQKKITFSKHEKPDLGSSSLLCKGEVYKQLLEMEKEDDLLDQLWKSRSLALERVRGNRQHIILVASLIDRIPNLAGLARTCEVFKTQGLAVADAKIVQDKQFQLISVTAEKWVPIIEVPVNSVKQFLEKKKREGFSILGLEQTANSVPLDQYIYPKKTVLVLGREKEGIPVDIIHVLDACIEIPQLGVVRSLNVHVSGAIALWEYTRQQRL